MTFNEVLLWVVLVYVAALALDGIRLIVARLDIDKPESVEDVHLDQVERKSGGGR